MPIDSACRPYHPHQDPLLPSSLQGRLPHDHGAYFVSDLVEHFDPSASEATYEDEAQGGPPYHPQRMVKILLYAHCTGVYASRRIARRLHEVAAFRVLVAGTRPTSGRSASFAGGPLEGAQRAVSPGLALAQQAGLVTLGSPRGHEDPRQCQAALRRRVA